MSFTRRPSHLIPLVISESRIDEYLGISYLSKALRDAGFEVQVFQMAMPGHADSLAALLDSPTAIPLVGLTWLYDASAPLAARAAATIKAARPNARVVVGGHPPSLGPEQALRLAPDVDYVLRGEADRTIVALAEHLAFGYGELAGIPGIAFRDDGIIRLGPAPSQQDDLDSLGWPDRDTLVQLIERTPHPETIIARLSGSRGCYARCEFCSMVSFYNLDGAGMKWRFRSPDTIVAEIEHLTRSFGLNRFWFVDDEFLGSPREHGTRALAIATLLIERGINIQWGFDARANGVAALSVEDLRLLYRSGVRVVAMGLESGSQAALNRLNKGMNIASNWEAVRRLREAGIAHRFGFIMYDPGTTLEDLQINVEFVKFAEPHRICNTGPYRLLNAEYPELGTPLALRLGVGATTAEALVEQNKPKLSQDGLGYEFQDGKVARIRAMLFSFAQHVVEPAMIPRPAHEPELHSDVWWEGTNYLAQNVAAMNAFLDIYSWVLDQNPDSWSDQFPAEAEQLFAERLSFHLKAESQVT